MRIDAPHADGNTRRKPQFGGPLPGQGAGRDVAAVVDVRQMMQHGQQHGIELGEELFGRIAAPLLGPHQFRTADAVAHLDARGVGAPRQHGGNPVAQFDDRPGVAPQRFVPAQQVQHLRPETFGRVVVARMAGVVDLGAGTEGVDLLAFGLPRMVLPQHEHRVGVFGVLLVQREGNSRPVGQAGGAGRRIDRQRPDVGRQIGMAAGHGAHRLTQRFEIILGMLAETGHAGIAVKPFVPAGIERHFGVDLPPREGIDQQGAHGIRSVVQTYYIGVFHG